MYIYWHLLVNYIYICDTYIHTYIYVYIYRYIYRYIWYLKTYFVYIIMLVLLFYTGAPLSIHSIPHFKIHPTAMERMLFWLLLCFFEYRIENAFVISDFNFSISKTPTMNLEKMLKIIYQKRSYLNWFCSVS